MSNLDLLSEPDWLVVLRNTCAGGTQAAVARGLGYSPSVINQVLKGVYKGDLRGVEEKVRALLIKESVSCPALGRVIAKSFCLEFQAKAARYERGDLGAASSLHQAVYQSCLGGCPFSKSTKGESHGA